MSVTSINDISLTNATAATQTASNSSDSDFSTYLDAESSTLEDLFKEAAQTYGVSENLLKAMAKQESNFDTTATSSSGAQGIMQLMPATAASLGVTDSYDARQNIMGGAKYISGLLESYGGDVSLALAAYNAGSGNVNKYGGIPPFEETQNYVTNVLTYMNEDLTLPDQTVSANTSTSDAYAALISSPSFTQENLNTLKTNLEIAVAAMNTPVSEVISNQADELFSYDDYLKFIDFYLKLQEAQPTETESTDTTSVAAQQITLNRSIINLFTGTTENN